MKRILVALSILVTGVLAITLIGKQSYKANADDHAVHHQQTKQSKPAKSDGSIDPNQIPELAAYEILLKMMSSPDLDKLPPSTRRAYSEAAGFNDEEEAAIINAGYEYREKIKGLDEQAERVKSLTWPEPKRQDMDHLAVLQNAKEGILTATIQQLQSRLANIERSKLSTHIHEAIRRNTKGFTTELPHKKVGFLNRLSDMFTASAQAPGCDTQVYIYSTTTLNSTEMLIQAWGDYSMPYNNCAHTISMNYEIWGPHNTYASSPYGAFIALEQPGGLNLDGYFASNSTAEFYCAIANQSGIAGAIGSALQQAPWIRFRNPAPLTDADTKPIIFGQDATTEVKFRYALSENATNSHTYYVSPGVLTDGAVAPEHITISVSAGSQNVNRSTGYMAVTYTLMSGAHIGGIYPSVSVSANSVLRVYAPTFAEVAAPGIKANQAQP
jgi:hypothetical protein